MAAIAAKEVKKDLYWVGVFDPQLRVFDIIMRTPFGTTYNSFLLKGSKCNVLFETAKEQFWSEYEARLATVLRPDEKIEYVVLNHTEPDHSGSLSKLLDRFPDTTIIATSPALRNLARITHRTFKSITIAPSGTSPVIDIGGYTLKFIVSPLLHWPDSMFTYIAELNTVVTCDFFGSHYCNEKVFSDLMTTPQELADTPEAYKYYYDCIFGPFKPHVLKGLQNLAPLQFDTICCSHGPVLRGKETVAHFIELYRQWSQPQVLENRVVIAYVSAYGFTRQIAETMAAALEASGVKADLFDLVGKTVDDAMASFESGARGLLLGTPTIVGEALPPIWDVTSKLNPIIHRDRVFGVFGSYGWSGEGTRNIQQRLDQLRCQVPLDPFAIVFRASQDDLKRAAEWATTFARAVKGEKINERKDKAAAATITTSKATAPATITIKNVPKDGKRRLWKCTVCGEVFAGILPPDVCPACGASADAFVCVGEATNESATQAQAASRSKFTGKIVIIGAGGAGISAAKAIREVNAVCSVTVVASEPELPYYRPSIPKLLAQPVLRTDPAFRLATEDFYVKNNVQLLLGTTATAIDNARHEVTVVTASSGQRSTLQYDRLIIATGGRNFVPKLTGLPERCSNVFGMRVAADVDAIAAHVASHPSPNVLIIGGGLSALETAHALRTRGVQKISIVEMMPRILPRQLSEESGSIYQAALARQGISLYLGSTCGKAIINDQGLLGAVELGNGAVRIECTALCLAVGTVPETALAQSAGCAMGTRAIVVDNHMQTSVPGIFACGDLVEFEQRVVPTWTEAVAQGRIAGLHAVDVADAVGFVRSPNPYFLDAFVDVFSVGNVDAAAATERISLNSASQTDHAEFFVAKDGKLIGAILMGTFVRKLQVFVTTAVFTGLPRAELFAKL